MLSYEKKHCSISYFELLISAILRYIVSVYKRNHSLEQRQTHCVPEVMPS